MNEKKEKWVNIFSLAFCIALMPPIWAVLSPYIGVSTGAVALICAGLYVANGNKIKDAFRICVGFFLGDLWAVAAIWIMETLNFNPDVELYFTLFILGALAVIIGEVFSKIIFTPAWLCGWAIGLTIMGPMSIADIGTLPFEIAAAMAAGVLYAGACVDLVQKFIVKKVLKK